MSGKNNHPVVTAVETWRCQRKESLFDSARTGRSPMNWDVVVLRLHTDVGVSGHATALAARSSIVTQAYLHETIAPVLLGRRVTEREAIWHELWTIDRHLTFFPVYLPGPVDVALWDIAAQAAGLPLYQFIGECRTNLPVYASSLFMPKTEDYMKQLRDYKKRGFTAYKAHPPGPWHKDMEIHHALRKAAGPDYVLMTDPVADYSLEEAIRVGRDLEKLNYHWFEEPFRDFELAKYAKLCAALDIPIAGTETTRGGPWGVAQAIAFNAVDIVRADVSWKAGVTGTLKIAHLAEAHGLRCEVHCTTMGFMDIANLHVSCAIKNCEYFELLVPEEPFRFPMKDRYPIDKHGTAHVPQKAGIGVELDWDAIDNTCVEHKITETR
ncbi:MAG TPA: enolase C-terminal domain-like protein [Candidatus Sulfotelmatobacter sp.]|jgi:L-alanine-DL-glutamate epimerase-like enolase superfamily enzyme|nr:enolase C-terminal domain-like protein [Candidatus Sulfotelmatobacter sp.]